MNEKSHKKRALAEIEKLEKRDYSRRVWAKMMAEKERREARKEELRKMVWGSDD